MHEDDGGLAVVRAHGFSRVSSRSDLGWGLTPDLTAAQMMPATASGQESRTAWLASSSLVRALARAAMNRCASGSRSRSVPVTRNQDGTLLHAAAAAGSSSAVAATGRWL